MKEPLNVQRQHWEKTFGQKPDMFGTEPSNPAKIAGEMFKKEVKIKILEISDGLVELAFCRVHQRRDFIKLKTKYPTLQPWADE